MNKYLAIPVVLAAVAAVLAGAAAALVLAGWNGMQSTTQTVTVASVKVIPPPSPRPASTPPVKTVPRVGTKRHARPTPHTSKAPPHTAKTPLHTSKTPPTPAGDLKVGTTKILTGNDDGEHMHVKLIAIHTGFSTGFEAPDAGKHYVAIEIMLKNTGTATYSDSPDNGAKLIDSRDNQIDNDIISDGPYQSSGSVNLPPGSQRRVFCIFQVPNGASLKQFQFTLDSGFAHQTAQWSL